MAIKQLTPEQVRSMSLAEKDAWWLAHVYRGDMPQLTLRAALTGMLLGGLLGLTNLYIGARTGCPESGIVRTLPSAASVRLMITPGMRSPSTMRPVGTLRSLNSKRNLR